MLALTPAQAPIHPHAPEQQQTRRNPLSLHQKQREKCPSCQVHHVCVSESVCVCVCQSLFQLVCASHPRDCHVYIPCLYIMSIYHVYISCIMSIYHVYISCLYTMSLYHVYIPCLYTMSIYHVYIPFLYIMSHVYIPCLYTMSIYHVYIPCLYIQKQPEQHPSCQVHHMCVSESLSPKYSRHILANTANTTSVHPETAGEALPFPSSAPCVCVRVFFNHKDVTSFEIPHVLCIMTYPPYGYTAF